MDLSKQYPEIFDLAKKLSEKHPNQMLEFYGPRIGIQADQITVWDAGQTLQAVINMDTGKYKLYYGTHRSIVCMLEHFAN